MGWILVMAVLACFGFLCALWVLACWLLPNCPEGILICSGKEGFVNDGFFFRYLLFRDLGLVRSPLVVVDHGMDPVERRILETGWKGIEVCTPDELSGHLELERNEIDGTGNGNSSGRDRRCGISEL